MNILYFLWAIPCVLMLAAEFLYIREELNKYKPNYREISWMVFWAAMPITNLIMLCMYVYCIVMEFRKASGK